MKQFFVNLLFAKAKIVAGKICEGVNGKYAILVISADTHPNIFKLWSYTSAMNPLEPASWPAINSSPL